MRYTVVPVILAAALAGCSGDPRPPAEWTVPGRWYTAVQVEQGREIFQAHCAVCHGSEAQGTAEWWIPEEDGLYPPPPLNGTAHDWHHPLDELLRYIEQGGIPLGGKMPAFGAVLDEDERRATVAFFQSFWPDEIYRRWVTIHQR